MAVDPQELQAPLTRTCQMGLIGHRKSDHAACTNRECGCHCHTSSGLFSKSWKVAR